MMDEEEFLCEALGIFKNPVAKGTREIGIDTGIAVGIGKCEGCGSEGRSTPNHTDHTNGDKPLITLIFTNPSAIAIPFFVPMSENECY